MGWLKRLFGREREDDNSVMSEWEHMEVVYGPPPVIEKFQQEQRNMRNRKEREKVLSEISIEPSVYGPPPVLRPYLTLRGISGEYKSRTFVDEKDCFMIGRTPECDICINHSNVISRQHVEFIYDENGWIVRCVGRNGIKFDGREMAMGKVTKLTQRATAVLELPSGDCFELKAECY